MTTLLEILLVGVLVILNGFFVAAEYAAVKLRLAQIRELIEKGDSRALAAEAVRKNIDSYLSATQIGITLASLALGWIGEPLFGRLLEPALRLIGAGESVTQSVAFIFGFLILTSVHIVIGEQIPKIYAINYEAEVALATSRPLSLYFRLFRPLIWALNHLVDFALGSLKLPKASQEAGHTREELRSMILESAAKEENGPVDEHTMLESLFDFSETVTREIMVHRSDVVGIDLDAEPREILRIIEHEGYSRLPVFTDSLDNVTGVLHVKDLLPYIAQLGRLSVPSQNSGKEFLALLGRGIRPAIFVSETQLISSLLVDFQRSRMHLAVVVSEHGGVEGIVTLEDILEELVGEIRDESDVTETPDVIEFDGGVYVDATLPVAEFNEQIRKHLGAHVHELEESGDYQTLSGYVQKFAGRIPSVGDVIEQAGLKFTVTRKSRHKLEQIKIEPVRTKPSARAPKPDTTSNGLA